MPSTNELMTVTVTASAMRNTESALYRRKEEERHSNGRYLCTEL